VLVLLLFLTRKMIGLLQFYQIYTLPTKVAVHASYNRINYLVSKMVSVTWTYKLT